jgi:hypothetical protein
MDQDGKRGSVELCIVPGTNGNVRLCLRRTTTVEQKLGKGVKLKASVENTTDEWLGELSSYELEKASHGIIILMEGMPRKGAA